MSDIANISDEAMARASGLPVEQVRAERERRAAAGRAARVPLPGPTADAFDVSEGVKVGPHTVRPFCDGDFENLQRIGHPLNEVLTTGDAAKAPFRGPAAWQLFWMLTRPLEESDAAIADKSLEGKARAQFAKLPLRAVLALTEAAYAELDKFWAPMLQYEAEDGGGEKKSSTSAPEPVKTVLDGSSQNVAA